MAESENKKTVQEPSEEEIPVLDESISQYETIKDKPLKYKLEYFWEYYRLPVALILLFGFIIFSVIRTFVTAKDYALTLVLVNADIMESYELTDTWEYEIGQLIGINEKKEKVVVDTSIDIGEPGSETLQYAALQKLVAFFTSQTVDIFVADSAFYEQYCQTRYLADLRDIYSEERLEELSEYIYYTDGATFSDYDDLSSLTVTEDQAKYIVDHRDPDSMKEPIPMGFYIPEGSRLGESGMYAYLADSSEYQGHPAEAIIGIPRNTPRIENTVKAIDYIMGR